MWDIGDVRDDVVDHAKFVAKTMKKTVSGPFLNKASTPKDESTPLLADGGSSAENPLMKSEDFTASTQVS